MSQSYHKFEHLSVIVWGIRSGSLILDSLLRVGKACNLVIKINKEKKKKTANQIKMNIG